VDPFTRLVARILDRKGRFVVIGVFGANYFATSGSQLFTTIDRDLFLPADAANLLEVWQACQDVGLELMAGSDPLDIPRDLFLARSVVERRASTRAIDRAGLEIDLSLTMTGFDFETVYRERRSFLVDGVEIPVARLSHILRSKAAAGRPKDHLFLETHRDILRSLLKDDEDRA
jgi:hypothetical protein